MRRKGFLLMEILLALLILSSLAAVVFPFMAQALHATDFLTNRSRSAGQALFAADFMMEKIRNNLKRAEAPAESNVYPYDAYVWVKKGSKRVKEQVTYRFFVESEKLKLRLHNGLSEPVTGETLGDTEFIAFEPDKQGTVFKTYPHGLVQIRYSLWNRRTRHGYGVETAILPYSDFYGEP